MATRNSKLQRIYTILVQPNSKIDDEDERQQSILLSAFQLTMIPFAVFTIVTADLVDISPELLILVAISAILLVYLISRAIDYKNSVRLVVTLYTLLPIIIWFSVTTWHSYDIPRILPYIIIALSIGALFTNERVVLVQGIVLSSIIIYTVGVVHNAPIMEYDSYLLTILSSALMVIVFSKVIDSYLKRLSRQSFELKRQKNELEIYTRLLRHDLSNDLQAVINSVELAQMLLPLDEEKVNENLEQSLSFTMRIQKLLHVFKLPLDQPGSNLVEMIQNIAEESERTHGNLSIDVNWTPDSKEASITVGRLMSLVWINIFRNASQHAGEHPVVNVDIKIVDQCYHIEITDNGPGIPQEKKRLLFRKDMKSERQDKGIGLYLSKLVIESHGGSLEIADTPETRFIIRIPTIANN